jgi:hypothetical protein
MAMDVAFVNWIRIWIGRDFPDLRHIFQSKDEACPPSAPVGQNGVIE